VSERARDAVAADARLLGIDDYVFEDGFALEGEEHELPASATRAEAIAAHARARGLTREECVGVGDSLDMAPAVGAFWLAADVPEHDPVMGLELDRHPNVRVPEATHGPGVYEAVVTTLAERR
jgi:hypothetical protein